MVFVLLLAATLGGCAQGGTTAGAAPVITDPSDPFEATNRRILEFNLALDDAVLRPVAVFYRDAVGNWTRTRIRNVLHNLNEPAAAANSLLQGRPLESAQTTLRFVFNSTAGLGGMFDLAVIGGPPRVRRDFGETLYVWGLADGPYLMLPVAGPSNPREFTGLVVNGFLNPLNYVIPLEGDLGRVVMEGLDAREQNIETLDEVRLGSLDVYARLRSLWRQNRDAELGRTSAEALDVLDDPGLDDLGAPPRR
jgi:phospholipid-binding lipoprotein MlaA